MDTPRRVHSAALYYCYSCKINRGLDKTCGTKFNTDWHLSVELNDDCIKYIYICKLQN